jgi:Tol biopolymer transport system component
MRSWQGISVRGLGAVGLACLVGAVFVAQAQAAFPGRNGQISFASDQTGSNQLYRVNPNGSDVDQLTHTSVKHNSIFSDWSPNGRELAFDSDRTGTVQIYTMHANGSDVDQITHLSGFSGFPSWSPDGKRIVFAHSSAQGVPDSLYTVRAEGGGLRRLTHAHGSHNQDWPQYSPNGRWILFFSTTPTNVPALYMMRANGSGIHRLTPLWLRAGPGDWSPNGRRIVSETNFDVPHSVIFTIRPTGIGVRILTSGPKRRDDFLPTYSPDGRQIVFDRVLSLHSALDLWIMSAHGGRPHDITNTPTINEFAPDWGTHHEPPGHDETDPQTIATAPSPSSAHTYPDRALLRR